MPDAIEYDDAALPSAIGMARIAADLTAQASDMDARIVRSPRDDTTLNRLARQATWDRRFAIGEVIRTMPARTLEDAVAVLVFLDHGLEEKEGAATSDAGVGLASMDMVRMALANVVPIVARAAGIDLHAIEGTLLVEKRDAIFGPLGN